MQSPLCSLLLLLLAPAAAAQQHLRLDGRHDFDGFGMSLALLDDVDGDGHPDFAVGAYCTDVAGHVNGGSVTAFSSATGQQLWMTNGDSPDERMGHCLDTLDDINGDGWVDVLTGAYRDRAGGHRTGSVHVLDGRTGARLYTIARHEVEGEFGKDVAAVDDCDGDGIRDWIAGAWLSDSNGVDSGLVALHSGADGAFIRSWAGPAGSEYGFAVGALGDVDGDGTGDFAIGGPKARWQQRQVGIVDVISGQSGTRLLRIRGAANSSFGFSVASAGDLDGDGADDFLVGAPKQDGAARNAGAVFVHSGADGSLLRELHGREPEEGLGWFVGPAGDANQDGTPDFFAGAPHHPALGDQTGMLRVHSGTGGVLLGSFLGWSEWDKLGSVALRFPDLNQDGREEWLIGAPEAGDHPSFEPGSVILVLDQPAPDVDILKLTTSGTSRIRINGLIPGNTIDLFASTTGLGFTALPPTDYLDVIAPTRLLSQAAPSQGRLTISGSVPAALAGIRIWFQAVDRDTGLRSAVATSVVQ